MNVLLTSVGRRTYLVEYFKKAVGEKGKVCVANSSALSPAFAAADHAVVTPLIYDPEYIPFLKQYCQEQEIGMLVSLFDIDLPVLAKHKKEFEEIGVQMVVSDYEAVEVCEDKVLMSIFLKERNLKTPDCYLSVEEALDAIEQGELSYPVMIKPRWGMGSLAIYEAENEAELRVLYEKSLRDINRSYLKYEAQADLAHAVMIQPKITGQEYGLDIINDLQGRYQTTIVKEKAAMRSGETDSARVVEQPVLQAVGEKAAGELKHVGNLDMDVLLTREGDAYIIDMNARFGGGYPYSHMAGVDLPAALVAWAEKQPVNPELLKARTGELYCKDIRMAKIQETNV